MVYLQGLVLCSALFDTGSSITIVIEGVLPSEILRKCFRHAKEMEFFGVSGHKKRRKGVMTLKLHCTLGHGTEETISAWIDAITPAISVDVLLGQDFFYEVNAVVFFKGQIVNVKNVIYPWGCQHCLYRELIQCQRYPSTNLAAPSPLTYHLKETPSVVEMNASKVSRKKKGNEEF